MRRMRMLSLGVAAAVLLAACGSDGDELSQEEFLAQADGICRAGNERMIEKFGEFFPAVFEFSDEEAQQIIDENGQTIIDFAVSNARGQIDDIRDLNGPSDLEDELDPLLDEASEILNNEISEEVFFSEAFTFPDIKPQLEALGLPNCLP